MSPTQEQHYNSKFRVTERKTGKEIKGAFVLLPEIDSAARTAIASYAEATNKPKIARWLRAWLHSIHRQRLCRKRTDGSLPDMSSRER